MRPRPARPEERAAALRLLLGHLPEAQRGGRAEGLLSLIDRGEMPAEGLLVVFSPRGLRGAVLAAPVPGAGGAMLPPVTKGPDPDAAAALVEAACGYLWSRGAKLVQALCDPEQAGLAAGLLANGFQRITVLVTLAHDLAELPPGPTSLPLTCYDPAAPGAFHAVLERTYEGTLDCPEVSGVRTIAEVIEGHKAQGRFDPSLWWALGEGRGVLIQGDDEAGEQREVAYIGIVPKARRQGWGRRLLAHALHTARRDGARRVTLAVDARNAPAWALYRALGFIEIERREVYLRLAL